MIIDNTKPSDNPTYNGVPNPTQTSGEVQTAGAVITNVWATSLLKAKFLRGCLRKVNYCVREARRNDGVYVA